MTDRLSRWRPVRIVLACCLLLTTLALVGPASPAAAAQSCADDGAPIPDPVLTEDEDTEFDVTPIANIQAQDLVNLLFGADVSDAVESVKMVGGASSNNSQIAMVTDLDQITGVDGQPGAFADFSTGLMMATGSVGNVPMTNTSESFGGPGLGKKDDQFDDGTGEFDVATLEFTFELSQPQTFTGRYVFASEEYLEWVNGGVNDGALVLVNGENVARAADGKQVSIDTINDKVNKQQYKDNKRQAPNVNFEPDGFTKTLSFTAHLPEGSNTIKIGISDRGDGWLDSWFFFQAGSFSIPVLDCKDTDGDGILDVDEPAGEEVDPCADATHPDYVLPIGTICGGEIFEGDVLREVAFVVDASESIDANDWKTELTGIANAMLDTTAFPLDGSVAVTLTQWDTQAKTSIPYTVLDSEAKLKEVVTSILALQPGGGQTWPNEGLDESVAELVASGLPNVERSLCMSTDGAPGNQELFEAAVAKAKENGVTRYSVLAIADPERGFGKEQAEASYGASVFGGGNLVNVANAAEFSSLVVGGCLSRSVELIGLEVNQAVQDWNGSIPLVEGKDTVVRAFVQSLDIKPDRIVARLHGERDGVPMPKSPQSPMNLGGSVLATAGVAANRADFWSSLNFQLPESWTKGDVTLRLEILGSSHECKETIAPQNTCTAQVSFQESNTPQVRMVRVKYKDDGKNYLLTGNETHEQARRLVSALPIADLDYKFGFLNTKSKEAPELSDVLASIVEKRKIDGSNAIYLGVLEGDAGSGLAAATPLEGAAWYVGGTESADAYGYARNRGVHEFAHTVGAFEAATLAGETFCSEPAEITPDIPAYPFVNQVVGKDYPTLGPMGVANTEVWGIDTRSVGHNDDLAVVDPNTVFSLMSYCESLDDTSQGRWTDAANYIALLTVINEIDWSEDLAVQTDKAYDYVRGLLQLNPDGTTSIEFKEVITVEPNNVPEAQPIGDYELDLIDANGNSLKKISFKPSKLLGDAGEGDATATISSFTIPIEEAPDYNSLVVSQAGEQIGSVTASANPPVVSLTSPVAGDVIGNSDLEVTWEASDVDGDELSYLVQYSIDGGENYETFAIDAEGPSATIPRATIAGSLQARVRVTASDGMLSTTVESPRFTVADSAPELFIDSPETNAIFDGAQSLFLTAEAIDAEDGSLDSNLIVWTSNRDGELGIGGEVVVSAANLSEGQHILSATISDSTGTAVVETRVIQINRVAALPTDVLCQGFEVTVDMAAGQVPTEGDDVILGTDGPDLIVALGGNDMICAGGGDDIIYGQAGDDTIFGEAGTDKIRGGPGADSIHGGVGADDLAGGRDDDSVFGGEGDDLAVRGGTGNDMVDGGPGNDPLVAGNGGQDIVSGGEGDDKVTGGPRPDQLFGGDGNDEVKGNKGADTIYGEAGDDQLFGGPQADDLHGGEGNDQCNGGTTGDGAIENDSAATCETESNIA